MATDGLEASIEPIGVYATQTFGAYLLGRACIRRLEDVRYLATLIFVQAAFMLPFAVFEALTSRSIILEAFSGILPTYGYVYKEPRLGLDQVQGTFEHPILFGIFMAFGFSLVFFRFKTNFSKIFTLPVIVINTFLSLSTGALLSIVVQAILIGWSMVFRVSTPRWRNLAILVVITYIAIDMASNRSPAAVFVDYLTFNTGNAYNRILIWEFGTAEVWRHPFFGLGFAADWERPYWMSSSMDNFWLVAAVRYGLPNFILLAAAFIFALYLAGRAPILDEDTVLLRRGYIMGTVGTLAAICSVHLWNFSYSWLMFALGGVVWFIDAGKAAPTDSGGGTSDESGAVTPSDGAKIPNKPRVIIGDVRYGETPAD